MTKTLTVNGTEYVLRGQLGHGKGGYSYLASGPPEHLVVIKQIHHEPCSYYTFGNKMLAELSDYEKLRDVGICMPRLLDADVPAERIVKEYIEGPTAYDLILLNSLPDWCIGAVEAMCSMLYPAQLNIDYFPTNFVPSSGRLYYVDYECNPYDPVWDFEHWGRMYWSRTKELLAYARRHEDLAQGKRPSGDLN